jgi:hypothetical protein
LAEFIGQDDDEGDSTSDFFPKKQVQSDKWYNC